MKSMPIFWRLVLNYGAILALSICGYAYFIIQLGGLSGTARAISDTDNRMIGYQERLTDSLLSEAQYGSKFTIDQAQGHYNQAAEFHKEVTRYLGALKAIAPSAEVKAQVFRLEQLHVMYKDLFDQEVGYARANQGYAKSRYQEQRENILNDLLRQLERLKNQLQDRLHAQLLNLDGVARTAWWTALASFLILLGLSLALAIKFSARLALPLKELKRRTEDDSLDNGASMSNFSAIPEMQELFEAMKREKAKFREDAASNAASIEKSTEELSAHLISVKRQFIQFTEAFHTSGNRVEPAVDPIMNELDNLIRYCAELNESLSATPNHKAPRPETLQTGAAVDCESRIRKALFPKYKSLWTEHRSARTTHRAAFSGFLGNLRDSLAHYIRSMKKSAHEKGTRL
jgi:hypothetical protein